MAYRYQYAPVQLSLYHPSYQKNCSRVRDDHMEIPMMRFVRVGQLGDFVILLYLTIPEVWKGVEVSDQSRKFVGIFSICDGNGSENITQNVKSRCFKHVRSYSTSSNLIVKC